MHITSRGYLIKWRLYILCCICNIYSNHLTIISLNLIKFVRLEKIMYLNQDVPYCIFLVFNIIIIFKTKLMKIYY